VHFKTDIFMIELNNYDMVLRVQWLSIMENIVSNYLEL
jgi:hypothetical protein